MPLGQPHDELLVARNLASPIFSRPFVKTRLARIQLMERIATSLGTTKGILVDISLSGALVEHEGPFEVGQRLTLRFDWRGESVVVESEVVRCNLHRCATRANVPKTYRTGLAFRQHRGSSYEVLREMVTGLVERALDERKSNANGVPPTVASAVMSGRIRGYLRLRLVHGTWQRVASGDGMQPSDGFTVSIDQDPGQIELLCQTYEKLSETDRQLVRKIAALSLANPEGLPARRFDP
jgi:hypothetical protein